MSENSPPLGFTLPPEMAGPPPQEPVEGRNSWDGKPWNGTFTPTYVLTKDPLKLQQILWPDVKFYREQRDIIYSVEENSETVVTAGNMLGKDYVAAFIALSYFIRHEEVRIITTSVKDDHLRVLWGEIGRFLRTCKYPLDQDHGGILRINHRDIRKFRPPLRDKQDCPISYLRGMVSEKGEGLAGHHAAHTLLIVDEASGVDDVVERQADTWATKKLIFGNPNPCTNFFRRAVQGGDRLKDDGSPGYYRKVFRISAEDSPNVRLALEEIKAGKPPSKEIIVPGVLPYDDGSTRSYIYRRKYWDPVRQCVGLDGLFWEGADSLLFPPEWLSLAEERARALDSSRDPRKPVAIGCDPGEGGANTSMAAVDKNGLVEMKSSRTPDTNTIIKSLIEFGTKHGVPPSYWFIDRGGGGKQHADRLRAMGYPVKTIAFGEPASPPTRGGKVSARVRQMEQEERYTYKNRRAEMYGILHGLLDPSTNAFPFGLPGMYHNLRAELAPIPLLEDKEGRRYLPPKQKPAPNSPVVTLIDLIGHSPDEADALVLAVFGMLNRPTTARVGTMFKREPKL